MRAQVGAEDLVASNRLYRRAATGAGEAVLADVLHDLGRVLVELSRAPAELTPSQEARLRGRLESDVQAPGRLGDRPSAVGRAPTGRIRKRDTLMTLVPRTTLRTLLAVLAALLLADPTSVTAVPLGPGSANAAPWSAPVSAWSGQPPDREDERDEDDEDDEREDDLYDDAYDALNDNEWVEAVELFDSAIAMAGPRVDAAMYWSAYARALFVLAHADSERAATLLASIAQGSSTPDLQLKAIQYLGMANSEGNRALLADIRDRAAHQTSRRAVVVHPAGGHRAGRAGACGNRP